MEDVERFVFCGRQFRGVVGWSNKGSHKLPKTQALGRWEMPAVRGNSGWWHGCMEIIYLKALIELGVGCFHPKNFETTTVVCVWGRNLGGGGDYTDRRVYKIHWDNVSTRLLLMDRGTFESYGP